MRFPLDTTPYPRDARSTPVHALLPDGDYAYVQDGAGVVYVVPDAPHIHPRVLGGGQPAAYAGDLTIRLGRVVDLTNLSGTFQFDDEAGLQAAAQAMRKQGLSIESGAVRFFPADGSRPIIVE